MSLKEYLSQNVKITLLMIGIIITGSTEHIIIPLFTTMYPSLYFMVLITTIEGCIIYAIMLACVHKYNGKPIQIDIYKCECTDQLYILILTGISGALMSICLLYSANPTRTPVVIQSIFLGLAIIPSVIFTYFILKKNNEYNPLYSCISMMFLLSSVGFAVIPIFNKTSEFTLMNILWIGIYMMGIILLSLTNILQEKYITITSNSFENKIRLAFYASIFQLVTIICFCWLDLFIGYNNTIADALTSFMESWYIFFTDLPKLLMIQVFLIDLLLLFLFSIYLNTISTNYNMILTNLTNQSVALFFTIFPHLNIGMKYPLYVTMLSLLCNIISVLFWVKGENSIHKEKIDENTHLLKYNYI